METNETNDETKQHNGWKSQLAEGRPAIYKHYLIVVVLKTTGLIAVALVTLILVTIVLVCATVFHLSNCF